ncbi:uncharacterized protein csdc2a isoform X2 [Oncorhynchus tshawytscha]|uniref:uncharacterized protein csdc2a isoform X2 n=1 Tax=Oncorhynchus tshawytscha TaxID=74940 RepID=UPI001C3E32D7|nr:uncharacterized protein csdc2a isoform X2 [Oncorhynchus tshawytscha]
MILESFKKNESFPNCPSLVPPPFSLFFSFCALIIQTDPFVQRNHIQEEGILSTSVHCIVISLYNYRHITVKSQDINTFDRKQSNILRIDGEYVPMEGDEVTYKVCSIPPKNQKIQAMEVVITHLAPGTKHETWSGQIISS